VRNLASRWAETADRVHIVEEHGRTRALDAAYGRLSSNCARIGAAGGTASFEVGSPSFVYCRRYGVRRGVLGLAGLIVRALMTQALSGAAFVAAFLRCSMAGGQSLPPQPAGPIHPDDAEQVLPKIKRLRTTSTEHLA